jgi:hypothetical protein
MDDPNFIDSFCVENNLLLKLWYSPDPDGVLVYQAFLENFSGQEFGVELEQLVSVVEQALKCVKERAQGADGNVAQLLTASQDAASSCNPTHHG